MSSFCQLKERANFKKVNFALVVSLWENKQIWFKFGMYSYRYTESMTMMLLASE